MKHQIVRVGFYLQVFSAIFVGAATILVSHGAYGLNLPSPLYPIAVAAGEQHSCALLNTGVVKCWGDNLEGAIGVPFPVKPYSTSALTVPLSGAAKAISLGSRHSCALLVSGKVQCWGDNTYDQLGGMNNIAQPVASEVPLAGDAISIAAGNEHTCAVVEISGAHKVQCWGRNDFRQLGVDGVEQSQIPLFVPGINSANLVASGAIHSCVTTMPGATAPSVICWGHNAYGELGRGTFSLSEGPGGIGINLALIDLWSEHSGANICGRDIDGSMFCWGDGGFGKIGNGSLVSQALPQPVQGLSEVSAGSGAYQTTCAVNAGAVYCWGFNNGQLISPNPSGAIAQPMAMPINQYAQGVAVGFEHACVLVGSPIKFQSSVKCWGKGKKGQLGSGNVVDYSFAPLTVIL